MLQELRTKHNIVPAAVIVSEIEAKDLKRELIERCPDKLVNAEETVDEAIGYIEGVPVVWWAACPRGEALLLPKDAIKGFNVFDPTKLEKVK